MHMTGGVIVSCVTYGVSVGDTVLCVKIKTSIIN